MWRSLNRDVSVSSSEDAESSPITSILKTYVVPVNISFLGSSLKFFHIVYAYSDDDCAGVQFPLDQVGCWVGFEDPNSTQTGVQGVIVICD